jgi:predicted metal-dependent hydrolase
MTTRLNWRGGDLAAGLRLYRARNYFEAHEQWEAVWLQSQGSEKTFLQALIQIAAACHHYERANRRGAQTLLRAALGRLNSSGDAVERGRLFELREALCSWLGALEESGVAADEPPEQVRLLSVLDR